LIFLSSKKWTSIILILLVVGLFIILALDFAALHDIRNEYISKDILQTLDTQLSKEVPAWTDNRGEWDYLCVSFFVKAVAYLALLILSLGVLRNNNKKV
jgi:hypothetical protein